MLTCMTENSSAGLVMLSNELAITVTGEEHHQAVLARYPVGPGQQRLVAVELGWCTVRSGKHRGQQAIEVRLDGRRVGELTHLMSQRYGGFVSQVQGQGGRPGCAAVIQRGERKLEIILWLPHVQAPVPTPSKGRKRPLLIGAGVVAVMLLFGGLANAIGKDNASPATSSPPASTTTSTEAPTTTVAPTTTQPSTTQPTTTLPPAPPPPPETTTKAPAPKTTTKTKTQPPPPPPPAEKPASSCDPNYTPCVPIASDVDCAGGSGNGPAYVQGPVHVIGRDIYDLDRDGDGIGCES